MTTQQVANEVNGVDVAALYETIDAIKETPDIAKFSFRANNKWVRGGHNVTTINDFDGALQTHTRPEPFVCTAGEPPVLLGEDQGASPPEHVLTGLAACLTSSMVYHAAARGIVIESVESTLEGNLDLHGFLGLDENIRNGYQNVEVKFKVKADAPEETIQELIELAQKRSPVFDIVSNPVNVKVTLDNN
jgi:uncharacterized OsmC-like protein